MEQHVLEKLLDGILSGAYDLDERFLSENEIAHRLNVPRLTARRALTLLEEMGYLRTQAGKGRFINKRAESIDLSLSGAESFTEKLRDSGHSLRTISSLKEDTAMHRHARQVLGLGPEDCVLGISRLRIIDGSPAAVHESYLSEKLFPGAAEDCPRFESMFAFFRSRGYESFSSGPSFLSVSLPRIGEQEVLLCPSLVPLLVVESSTLSGDEGPTLQYSRILYRSDLFIYRAEL